MVIAAAEQGSPRRRAQRGSVEAVVAQALRCELLHVGRRHAAAENTELSEADIVEQDQNDVWSALRRPDDLRKGSRIGVLIGAADFTFEVEIRSRQR
jgi:hypothetical protein